MNRKVWVDGEFLDYKNAGLDEDGWPSGSGIFETIRTVEGRPWELDRHMRRALSTARRADQYFPTEEFIRNGVRETLEQVRYPVGRLRLLFSSDSTLRITHNQYSDLINPARLLIFQDRVINSQIVEKRYPYISNLRLLGEAKSKGFDDGILVNQDGQFTETAISNLLLLINGEWITPPLRDGVLPGIMRGLLIEKLKVIVRPVKAEDSSLISGALLISSLKIAQVVCQIGELVFTELGESEQMRSRIAAAALASSVG